MKYNVNSIYLCDIYQVFDVILNKKEDTTTFMGSFVKKALVYRDDFGYFVDLNTGEKYYSKGKCIGDFYVSLKHNLIPVSSFIDYKKENMSKKKILKKYNEYNNQIKEKE